MQSCLGTILVEHASPTCIAIDVDLPVCLRRAHLVEKRGQLVEGHDAVGVTAENENLGVNRSFCWRRSTQNAV